MRAVLGLRGPELGSGPSLMGEGAHPRQVFIQVLGLRGHRQTTELDDRDTFGECRYRPGASCGAGCSRQGSRLGVGRGFTGRAKF